MHKCTDEYRPECLGLLQNRRAGCWAGKKIHFPISGLPNNPRSCKTCIQSNGPVSEPGPLLFWTPEQRVNELTLGKQAGPAFALFSTTAAEQLINFSSFSQSCLFMDIFQILHSLSVMYTVLHRLGYTANSKEL